MSQHELSSTESSTRSASTAVEHQAQAHRHVPLFHPIDVDKARARAATEQWRTFTMLLEPQVGAANLGAACVDDDCVQQKSPKRGLPGAALVHSRS